MSQIDWFIARPSRRLGWPRGRRLRVPILMYHRLTSHPDPHPCSMVAGRFRSQLKILHALGYRTVSPRDIARAFRSGSPLPARPISITFDDGYVDTLTVALPILKEFGFTAACFVVADRVGQFSDWTAAVSLMGWPEIREWLAAGMEVGSHSRTHRDLTLLSAVELQDEVIGSRKLLEDRLGCAIPTFAYPFTFQGPREREAVEAAGYEAACAGVQPHDSVFALARVEAASDSLSWFLAQLLPVYPELHHLYVLARRRARAWLTS
jgi:peptidoglycan/xylan/chitin deacetylase (PgdA/CDA1 family)